MEYDVKDIKAADAGRDKMEWAERRMPVLRMIRERFAEGEAPQGGAHLVLPPRDHGDGQPGGHPEGRRGRGAAYAPPTP